MISSLHLYFLYYFYVSGILKKKRTYAILAIEKKLRSNWTHKENPRGGHLWGFPHHKDAKTGWLSLVISVQPFADKVTDNTRHDGENKRNYKIQLTHLLSVARLEKGSVGILAYMVEFEKPPMAAFLIVSYLSEPAVSASDVPI